MGRFDIFHTGIGGELGHARIEFRCLIVREGYPDRKMVGGKARIVLFGDEHRDTDLIGIEAHLASGILSDKTDREHELLFSKRIGRDSDSHLLDRGVNIGEAFPHGVEIEQITIAVRDIGNGRRCHLKRLDTSKRGL